MFEEPSWDLEYTILPPVVDHVGEDSLPGVFDKFTGSAPSAFITKISVPPSTVEDENRIFDPSGDQEGLLFFVVLLVKRVGQTPVPLHSPGLFYGSLCR